MARSSAGVRRDRGFFANAHCKQNLTATWRSLKLAPPPPNVACGRTSTVASSQAALRGNCVWSHL